MTGLQLIRTIELALNKFDMTPLKLIDPSTRKVLSAVTFDAKKLFHHHFIVRHGPRRENNGTYEYEGDITAGPDWRFLGSGIGEGSESKRNASNEFGRAFARWFHDEYLGFTYFCPLEDVLEHVNPDGSKWTRREDGNLPDYVCGKSKDDAVHLLEAKGRYTRLNFKRGEFGEFRKQIQRAQLLDAHGKPQQVKGFISVAMWATEKEPTKKAKLLVEDPMTIGEPPGQGGYPRDISRAMVLGHYAPHFELLQLPVYADAIRLHQQVPVETGTRRVVWECVAGPLVGKRFVGGVMPDDYTRVRETSWVYFDDGEFRRPPWVSLVLTPPMRFFGVEKGVMRSLVAAVRGAVRNVSGQDSIGQIEGVEVPEETGSLSLLRDGSVLGPADYFRPVDMMEL